MDDSRKILFSDIVTGHLSETNEVETVKRRSIEKDANQENSVDNYEKSQQELEGEIDQLFVADEITSETIFEMDHILSLQALLKLESVIGPVSPGVSEQILEEVPYEEIDSLEIERFQELVSQGELVDGKLEFEPEAWGELRYNVNPIFIYSDVGDFQISWDTGDVEVYFFPTGASAFRGVSSRFRVESREDVIEKVRDYSESLSGVSLYRFSAGFFFCSLAAVSAWLISLLPLLTGEPVLFFGLVSIGIIFAAFAAANTKNARNKQDEFQDRVSKAMSSV